MSLINLRNNVTNDLEQIYLPNEIFDDLKMNLDRTSSSHLGFAYCYYLLISYLYRYCKYETDGVLLKQDDLKELLGYARKNKGIDYIIKDGGLLDNIGYTESTSDYPIAWEFAEDVTELSFYTIKDLKLSQAMSVSINMRNYKIKRPVKAFKRYSFDELLTGTFYDISNTHCHNMELFFKALESGIGVIGYYIYSYLMRMNSMYVNGYDEAWDALCIKTGIPSNTLNRYIHKLEENRFITVTRHTAFSLKNKGKKNLANSYYTSSPEEILLWLKTGIEPSSRPLSKISAKLLDSKPDPYENYEFPY
ncbi:hypothetical protein FHS18_001152 [Paenibacillus phyllosphaerae]|uniref:Uncharacterized protein n=1 Tax=Paenibacillus phyllosphaerae TaxID=274593 RepID=A0A7W5AUN2_9BACL|nr:hypothetical protein [Paenibacillus phyllosphaerae]MBB3109100.1 hypothetical protein [Paenibacillus phyllosphaerae]